MTPPSGSRTMASSAVALRVSSTEPLEAAEEADEDAVGKSTVASPPPSASDDDGDEVEPDSRKAAQVSAYASSQARPTYSQ